MGDVKLAIKQWPIDKLVPYARNARTHSPEQVNQIAASITEFGFVNPVGVDSGGTLIWGHGRVMAAKQLGMKTVPVIELGHLTDAQAAALRIADNQLGLNASWDLELLRGELVELQAADYDLKSMGFSDAALSTLIDEPEIEQADTSPKLSGLEYRIIVKCRDEMHQCDLLQRLDQEGLECQALIS